MIFASFAFFVGRVRLVEDAEVAGERLVRQLVGGEFVGHVVVGGHQVEHAAFARD